MSRKTVHTLEDIARLANVSTSTVSRALNDSPLLNPKTKERIQAIAREHNFRINIPARNLRLGQSHTIAFVDSIHSPEFFSEQDMFSVELLRGVGSELRVSGYDLLLVHVNPHELDSVQYYHDSGRVDGFIFKDVYLKKVQIKELIDKGVHFITRDDPLPGMNYCTVSGDNIAGGMLAVQHLILTGRKRIAFLGGLESELTVQRRYKGYEKALLDAGRKADPDLVVYGDYSYLSGINAMQRLLEQAPDLDAVFVNSDLMAIAAINVIQRSGKRVPEDIGVVGYDDLPIAMFNNLPLTTIRQNLPLAGQLLARNLIQHIQSGVVTNVTLPVELVVRESA